MNNVMNIHESVLDAPQRIYTHLKKTPLEFSDQLSDITNARVFLKLEFEQITHSFKARGAFNKIIKLVESGQEARLKKTGLIITSTGNAGIAYVSWVTI
ncbi:putative threonine dehydratase [Saccoglossus kowalevskii]|uniref:L-serine ammonia-lyase n=1 Tax=Saccoglossus kowalevskii TaxID=10224 RepID=A0ABM0MCZ4_SACKO|nr:PREDICTED: threo-3-hydroxyaspartate ammonia-lyase-like [Saccoglossus kowalevskii]